MTDPSDEMRMEAARRGGHMEAAHGIAALNGDEATMSPAERMIAAEIAAGVDTEGAEDFRAEELRSVFWDGLLTGSSRLRLFLFADRRPEEPEYAAARLYAVAREYFPSALQGVGAEVWAGLPGASGTKEVDLRTHRAGGVEVRERVRMPLGELMAFHQEAEELFADWEEQEAFKAGGMKGLRGKVEWYLEGAEPGRDWRPILRRVYADAKCYDEPLLKVRRPVGGLRVGEVMGLRDLAVAFREENLRAARSRWSWRIRKVVNERVESLGLVAHAPWQKSETACRNYAQSARGNTNRRGKTNQ